MQLGLAIVGHENGRSPVEMGHRWLQLRPWLGALSPQAAAHAFGLAREMSQGRIDMRKAQLGRIPLRSWADQQYFIGFTVGLMGHGHEMTRSQRVFVANALVKVLRSLRSLDGRQRRIVTRIVQVFRSPRFDANRLMQAIDPLISYIR